MRSVVVIGVGLVAALALPSPANAADIASVLRRPGNPLWNLTCGPNRSVPQPLSYGIADCAPLGAFWEPLCLHRVDIDLVEYPSATCGDGTGGSFYVRPGVTDPDRWVIHLQGGGGCNDQATCKDRWCGRNGPYDAAQMSSDWNGDGTKDSPAHGLLLGISELLQDNLYYGWTHVYVPYCSSDLWQGRVSDVDLGNFNVDAQGHAILHAVRRMLRKNGNAWTVPGAWTYTVPDLDDASEIIFSGTSAGGFGAVQNADWFLGPLDARSGLVVDAAVDVSFDAATDHDVWATEDVMTWNDARLDLWADRWATGGYYDAIDAFVDETCSAANGASLENCISPAELLLDGTMIETPTMARVDLEDPVLATWITDSPNPDGDSLLVGGSAGIAGTTDDFAAMMRDTLVDLAAVGVSVHAPKCAVHVGLELHDPFHVWETPNTDDDSARTDLGDYATAHDAIWNWFDPDGSAFTWVRRIDTDEPGVSLSCP